MSVSARFYPTPELHIGLDRIYDDETAGGGSCAGENPIPGALGSCDHFELNIQTKYLGPSLGYYIEGYANDTWVGVVSAGQGQRKFVDANFGEQTYSGLFGAVEVGYQWRTRLGILGLSLRQLHSNLETEAEFTQGQFVSKYKKSNFIGYVKANVIILI
jgi:hypothetical protein